MFGLLLRRLCFPAFPCRQGTAILAADARKIAFKVSVLAFRNRSKDGCNLLQLLRVIVEVDVQAIGNRTQTLDQLFFIQGNRSALGNRLYNCRQLT